MGVHFVGAPPILPDADHVEVLVGFIEPLVPYDDGTVLLGSLVVNVPGPECCEITAGSTETPSIPGHAVYVDAYDPTVLVPLGFLVDPEGDDTDPEGWMTLHPASVNCGAVANEPATWTGIKALFR